VNDNEKRETPQKATLDKVYCQQVTSLLVSSNNSTLSTLHSTLKKLSPL